jgi:hypothetical protein
LGISLRCINNNIFSAIDEEPGLGNPEYFSLFQNYPNPFNPSTMIIFVLPKRAKVVLNIFNKFGEKVFVLVDSEKEGGTTALNGM